MDYSKIPEGDLAQPPKQYILISLIFHQNRQEGAIQTVVKSMKHPTAGLFHLLFKCLALTLYMFGSWITSNFVILFVLIELCLAFDFWTVKNITGRYMVGLRWWNKINENGDSTWMYETIPDRSLVGMWDSYVFWGVLVISITLWGLFLVFSTFALSFRWIPVVLTALILHGTNMYGFFKASRATNTNIPYSSAAGSLFSKASTKVASQLFKSTVKSTSSVPV